MALRARYVWVAVLAAAWLASPAKANVPLVALDATTGASTAGACVVLPDDPERIAVYAADEFVWHVEKATGVRLPIERESGIESTGLACVFIGTTQQAARAGIDVDTLAPEACVLRTDGPDLYIAGKDGPGDPLSVGTTHSGTLWGVYEILERTLGVRWLWPGELGTYVPRTSTAHVTSLDETIAPRFIQRNLRPIISPNSPGRADERLAFSPAERARYAHEQTVYLRRHRMGRSEGTYYSQRRSGGGHAFHGWYERYGEEHPDWFQMLPDGRRAPEDPARPDKVTMCVSNPELHREVIKLWQEERAKHPGVPVNISISENDRSAKCQCPTCLSWDGPAPDLDSLPPGLERSFTPVQAGTRYARFAKEIHTLASAIDPDVKVNYYA